MLVVFSSLSFSIEKHICEGEIIASFFKKGADLCVMQTPDCHNEITTSCCSEEIEKSNCCMDTSEFIRGITIEQRAQTEQSISLQPVLFLLSDFFYLNLIIQKPVFSQILSFRPVLKSIDIGLLCQVFRI